jgi:hypothetical protein
MRDYRIRRLALALVAVGGVVVGLAVPPAVSEASTLINGKSIAKLSIPGNRLENNTVTGREVKESTLGIVPKAKQATVATRLPALKWHTVTTFELGWKSDIAAQPVGYAIDAQGIVHLRGVIAGGSSGSSVMQLPTSFGNAVLLEMPAADDGGVGYLTLSGGDVVAFDGTGNASDFMFLNGVTFALHVS